MCGNNNRKTTNMQTNSPPKLDTINKMHNRMRGNNNRKTGKQENNKYAN